VLQGLKEKYERHHRVVYSEEAMEAAVKLSNKYIADRFMPDKVCVDLRGHHWRLAAQGLQQEILQSWIWSPW
jgi:ATP-dependent Clp protease ATP-binding subunit ClpC